jgi:hypothetical protein
LARESSAAPKEGANLMIGLGLGSCQADLPPQPVYRFWHGPVVGLTVSHVWSSYAACLFLELGALTPGSTYTDLKGDVREFRPKGMWSITSMKSWPAWWLRQNGSLVASFESCGPLRIHALRLLIGRRLNSVEVDQQSKSTRLNFSLSLQLETKTDIQQLRHEPHRLMRGPEQGSGNWPHIALRPWSETPR